MRTSRHTFRAPQRPHPNPVPPEILDIRQRSEVELVLTVAEGRMERGFLEGVSPVYSSLSDDRIQDRCVIIDRIYGLAEELGKAIGALEQWHANETVLNQYSSPKRRRSRVLRSRS